ncbi:phosphotransferase [Candidatus Woesearchaeota archaeon]|nr:phosphotransferase [Candidatus Woesearchaeota archaeon]
MIIKLPFSCNNACTNCPGDRCFTEDWISEEMRKDPKTFFIVGGEPTIQQTVPLCELAEKLVHDVPDCKIVLCTNGRTLAYKSVAKSLVHSGINNFIIFLPSPDRKENNEIAQTEDSFEQTRRAIEKLSKLPVNTVIQTIRKENTDQQIDKFIKRMNAASAIYNTKFSINQNRKNVPDGQKSKVTQINNTEDLTLSENIQHTIKRDMLKNYGITDSTVSPIWSGNYNLNYTIITKEKKAFLKIFCSDEHEESTRKIEFQHKLLEHLKQKRLLTLEPERTSENNTYFLFKNKPAAIYNFVDGKTIEFREENAKEAFAVLISYHKAVKDFWQEYPDTMKNKTEKTITALEKDLENEQTYKYKPELRKHKEKLMTRIEKIKKEIGRISRLPHVTVHGDFRAENLISAKNGTYLVDMQNLFTGPATYDLAAFCVSFNPPKQFDIKTAEQLERFQKETSITEEEVECFPSILETYLFKQLLNHLKERRYSEQSWTDWFSEMLDKTETFNKLPK